MRLDTEGAPFCSCFCVCVCVVFFLLLSHMCMENSERLTLKGRKERRCGRARSHLRGWWRHADVANATGAQRTHLSLVFYSSLSLLLRFSFSFLSLSAFLLLPFSAAVTWAARTRRALRLLPECTPNSHQPNCSNGTESPLLSTFGAFLFETANGRTSNDACCTEALRGPGGLRCGSLHALLHARCWRRPSRLP